MVALERYSINYETVQGYLASVVVEAEGIQEAFQQAVVFNTHRLEDTRFTTLTRMSDNKLLWAKSEDYFKGPKLMEAITVMTPEPSGKIYVRFENGQNTGDWIDYNPEGFFNPEVTWAEVPSYLAGWITQDYVMNSKGNLAPPSMDYLANQFGEQAKIVRKSLKETGFITYKNHRFPTKTSAYTDITNKMSTISLLGQTKTWTENWKTDSGYLSVNYNDLIEVSKLIDAFHSNLFDREKKFIDGFRNRSLDNIEEILIEFQTKLSTIWAN